MLPLGHAAVGYLCYTLSTRVRHDTVPRGSSVLVALFGTQFPDLVDKPLAWGVGVLPAGRTLAHSLLVLVPLCLLAYVLTRHSLRSELAVAFTVGALSHALVDALPSLWSTASISFLLWPVLSVHSPEGSLSVLAVVGAALTSPWFLLELLLAVLALFVWHRDGVPGLATVRRVGRRASPL
jgi:hypothetical protein